MSTVTITPASIKEYRSGTQQTGETIRMGTQLYNGQPWYHDVVIELNLPKTLKSLTVYQDWSGHESGSTSYVFNAALTQTPRTSAPSTADLTFRFSSSVSVTINFTRKLQKGKWYLWLWRHNTSTPSFAYGSRGSHPTLTITGVVVPGGQIYRSGAWKSLEPKIYKDSTWKSVEPKEYNEEWAGLE